MFLPYKRYIPFNKICEDRQSLLLNDNIFQFYIGIACLLGIIINKNTTNIHVYVDCGSDVRLQIKSDISTISIIINNKSKLEVKLFIRNNINTKIIAGSGSKIKLLIENILTSPKFILITSILSNNVNITILSNAFMNKNSTKQTIYNSIIGSYSIIKIVLNVLLLGRSYIIIKPIFRIKKHNSTCNHSVNISNALSNLYFNRKIINIINFMILNAYNKHVI
ncbi:hypothetical protein alecur_2 [Candidatus Hodgkinia cicadicola]|uniref:Uncharacterized protein n=1 Tax=Candidatus Hodgkinia cicadicola TaxID=573658 RepID=A0ABX4MKJ6_9HYPH|nr:hypothetical protein alecur_2 [Candidatus Hodgkinia cicadicola]